MKPPFPARSCLVVLLSILSAGCPAIDVWRPPAPTPEEYARGLIVLYPGSSNLVIEQLGFYTALKESGVDLAIEVRPWGQFLEHVFDPIGTQPRFTEFARQEAARLSEYIRAHPGVPVNLMTYSGGAIVVPQIAAAMPADAPIDRIIMLSPGVASDMDLSAALARTSAGMIVYWSPREEGVYVITEVFGLADGRFDHPAAALGFDETDARLTQVEWSPEMAALGNNGEHLDYFFNIPWIKAYVVPWILTRK